MMVNFTNGMITNLSGTTTSSAVTGTNISINMQNGTFTGGIMLNGAFVGGSALDGRVYGDFHGNGATDVSGVYHDSNGSAAPRYFGGFAGSR